MEAKSLTKKQTSGFSLVEMLIVIAVIGIIAAIAVPTIGNVTSQANTAKAKRNAQNLASVYSSGLAAGLNFQGVDKAAIIADVVSGDSVTDSSSLFQGTFFGVPNLSADEKSSAAEFLELSTSGRLVYAPGGGADDTPTEQTFSAVTGANAGDPSVVANINAAQSAGWTGVNAVNVQELIPGTLYLFEVRGTPPV